MLQKARVTAFTVSELLRENQQEVGGEGLKRLNMMNWLKKLTILRLPAVVI